MSEFDLHHGTTLVLGGARSGKSAFAEQLILASDFNPIYIATSQIWDDEMRLRVDVHIERRGDDWICLEAPDDLEGALLEADSEGNAILVDCLTLWLTNLMMADADIDARIASLLAVEQALDCPVVFVSNEVGLGIVPDNKMARAFRDYAGRLHQNLAASASQVFFIAAGLPLKMKG